jgi:hypothetical protein
MVCWAAQAKTGGQIVPGKRRRNLAYWNVSAIKTQTRTHAAIT